MLLWGEEGPRSFFDLQKRLNRTRPPEPQLDLFGRQEARFVAYDLIESDGIDLRDRPCFERRLALGRLIENLDSDLFVLSGLREIADWTEAAALRDTARERGTEGLMLKPRDSTYGVGRTSGWGLAEVEEVCSAPMRC